MESTESRTSQGKVRLSRWLRQGRKIRSIKSGLIGGGDRQVQFLRLSVQRFHLLQTQFFRGPVEEGTNGANARANLLEERFVGDGGWEGFNFFSEIVDQITLPEDRR